MKKTLLLLLSVITFSSCSSDADAPIFLPIVKKDPKLTTQAPSFSIYTVQFNGTVTSLGDGYSEKGFCWSLNTNPIITDNAVQADGSGVGAYFTEEVYNGGYIEHNKTYNVRAYARAVHGAEYIYGNNVTFTTP